MEEGIFEIIVIQNPFKMGYLGIEAAVEILNGGKVEKHIDSGCELISNDSVYTEENQKLLFPFREDKGRNNRRAKQRGGRRNHLKEQQTEQ